MFHCNLFLVFFFIRLYYLDYCFIYLRFLDSCKALGGPQVVVSKIGHVVTFLLVVCYFREWFLISRIRIHGRDVSAMVWRDS